MQDNEKVLRASSGLEGVKLWMFKLAASATLLAQQDQALYKRFQQIIDMMNETDIMLTFGGHFSSGKSTLLNAALGRSILPVDELPETGTLCILRSGEQDRAIVVRKNRRQQIECTTSAIQQMTSLISPKGERQAIERVDQLELTLARTPIPAHAAWIDSPGINDTVEMNERALVAARKGDMLIWVLTSRQPLSEVEMAFITQYVAERGPEAVIFLLNAFLPDDTPQEWERFLQQKLHVYRNKVYDHATLMGFTQRAMPVMLVVSARAVCNQSTNSFGAQELRRFLFALNSAQIGTIQRVRLRRAEILLRVLAKEYQVRREQEQAKFAERQEQRQRADRQAETWAKAFKQALEEALDSFFAAWTKQVRGRGMFIHNQINSQTLGYDHNSILNREVRATTEKFVHIFLQELQKIIQEHQQLPLSNTAIATLVELLAPPNVSIPASDARVTAGGAAWGAGIGAAVGTVLLPGVGTALGAGIGGTVGAIVGNQNKENKAIQETQRNIAVANEQAIATFQNQRQAVLNVVMMYCTVKTPAGMTEADTIASLENIQASLLQLAEEAAKLIHG